MRRAVGCGLHNTAIDPTRCANQRQPARPTAGSDDRQFIRAVCQDHPQWISDSYLADAGIRRNCQLTIPRLVIFGRSDDIVATESQLPPFRVNLSLIEKSLTYVRDSRPFAANEAICSESRECRNAAGTLNWRALRLPCGQLTRSFPVTRAR